MKVSINDKDELVIRIPLKKQPKLSSTKKTKIVASTHGYRPTTVEYAGQPVSVSVNATIPKE